MFLDVNISEVIECIRNDSGHSDKEIILPESRLEADLGITGDDGVELLQALEKAFAVSFSEDDYTLRDAFGLDEDEYLFHSEGTTLFHENVKPVTVADVHRAIRFVRMKQLHACVWKFIGNKMAFPSGEGNKAMGLDYIEMIMEVEEKYGIDISDKEAGQLRTVGDLHGLVCTKLLNITRDVSKCPCLDVFQRLRRGLMQETGVERCQIRLETPVETLLPLKTRGRHWGAFRTSTGLALPPLHTIPNHQTTVSFSLALLLGAAICFYVMVISLICVVTTHSLVAAVILIISSTFFVQCWRLDDPERYVRTLLPEGCVTFRDFVQHTVELNKTRYAAVEPSPYTQEGIWKDIEQILVVSYLCDPKSITPEARLYEDLALG